MIEAVDALVFKIGWKPADVERMTIADIIHWCSRANAWVARRKE